MKLVSHKEVLYTCKKIGNIVEFESFVGKSLIKKMIDFCIDEHGVGLAAPQIGVYYRFFVAINLKSNKWNFFINPLYIAAGPVEVESIESCLTYGLEKFYKVKRFKKIKAVWFVTKDRKLIKKTKVMSSKQAILFQHETDHINSITIATSGEEIIER